MKLVYGKGVNDLPYKTQKYENSKRIWVCPFYDRWTGVLERCYSEAFKIKCPTYQDSLISDRWLKASEFKAWMEDKEWEGKVLDKDILIPGNKIYSSETCTFVPKEINIAFSTNIKNRDRGLPTGIMFLKSEEKYLAQITRYGKVEKLGRSKDFRELLPIYKKAREDHIKDLALKYKDDIEDKVFQILINYEERSGEQYASVYKSG